MEWVNKEIMFQVSSIAYQDAQLVCRKLKLNKKKNDLKYKELKA